MLENGTLHFFEQGGAAAHDKAPVPTVEDAKEFEAVVHQAETTIEADDGVSIDDTGYETEGGSRASTCIHSSIRDYSFEHGRRYHKFREGSYFLPNDDAEQDREDMKHAMFTLLCGDKLHYAPLENPQQILDIGTMYFV